jgi:2-keto-4-pentenoate hydratase/2-oxohepta-3-ene-1,7-dioic acid hydratase in catechol pathway
MKIVRLQTPDGIRYGGVEEEGIRVHEGTPLVAWEPTEVIVPFPDAKLLSPILPTKVVCVGRNYETHAEELGNEVPQAPMIFLKPSTSVIGPEQAIVLPQESDEVHHEAELAVVIGTVARRVRAENAHGVILGYTAANDVSARDLQKADGQWGRAKGFDTFCPLGPAIETEFDPLEGHTLECLVNGEVRQSASITDLVFGVSELVEFITGVMTLLPGDVILTGTPAGVGPIVDGDRVEVCLEGIGTLSNPVVAR